jgi:hypothetical protein
MIAVSCLTDARMRYSMLGLHVGAVPAAVQPTMHVAQAAGLVSNHKHGWAWCPAAIYFHSCWLGAVAACYFAWQSDRCAIQSVSVCAGPSATCPGTPSAEQPQATGLNAQRDVMLHRWFQAQCCNAIIMLQRHH